MTSVHCGEDKNTPRAMCFPQTHTQLLTSNSILFVAGWLKSTSVVAYSSPWLLRDARTRIFEADIRNRVTWTRNMECGRTDLGAMITYCLKVEKETKNYY